MSGTYEDLVAWQRAMDLVLDVYRITRGFPKEELYALTAQMRRAAVSIPSNVAEGKGRYSDKELLHFLSNARGSIYELQTQIALAHRLGYMDDSGSRRLADQAAAVGQLVNALIRAYRPNQAAGGFEVLPRTERRKPLCLAESREPKAESRYSYASASIGSFCAALYAG